MSLKMADVSVLDVLLYEEPIGTLIGVPGDRTLFAFNDRYIEDENRHVLLLKPVARRTYEDLSG
jgi:serine/threonine-protein kinase HipA